MGHGGMDDLFSSGVARNNPGSSFAGQPLYASQGAPLERYTTNRGSGSHVLEFEPSENSYQGKGAAVRETNLPNRYFDKTRVWEQTAPGNYQVTYDNFNPVKRGLRTIGAGYLAPAAVMAIPEAVGKAMDRLGGAGVRPNFTDFAKDFGSAMTMGVIPDAGEVPAFSYGDEGNWVPRGARP